MTFLAFFDQQCWLTNPKNSTKPLSTPEPPPKRASGRLGRPPSKRGPGRPPKRGPGRPPKYPKSPTYSSLTPAQLTMVSTTVKADSVYHFQHIDQSRINLEPSPISPPIQSVFTLPPLVYFPGVLILFYS